MDTIMIPKRIGRKGDLLIVPRREYEKLLSFWEGAERITGRERKAIAKGFREIAERKFLTAKQLRHELGL